MDPSAEIPTHVPKNILFYGWWGRIPSAAFSIHAVVSLENSSTDRVSALLVAIDAAHAENPLNNVIRNSDPAEIVPEGLSPSAKGSANDFCKERLIVKHPYGAGRPFAGQTT